MAHRPTKLGKAIIKGKSRRPRRVNAQEQHPVAPVKIIMAAGEVLMPNRFRKVLPAIADAHHKIQAQRKRTESLVTDRPRAGREGVPEAVTHRSPAIAEAVNNARRADKDSL